MNNSLPYKVFYCIDNQICKKCKINIKPGRLQMGTMMQSDDDDCRYPDWYHMKCFFKVCLPQTEAAFDGFTKLRYADQLAIKVHLGTLEDDPEPMKKEPTLPDFFIEYSKTDRDACVGCQQKIEKNTIRVMNVVYDTDNNTAYDGKAVWYHVICFARSRTELGWLQEADALPGFKRLTEDDKEIVRNQIPLISRQLYKPTETRTNPNQEDLEKLIEAQNKEYYALYDNLEKHVSNDDQITILRANIQRIPVHRVDRLHHLTDVLYFGALFPCESCKTGELEFVNSTYVCSAIGNWSKCSYDVKEPSRRSAHISDDFVAKYPFLQSYSNSNVRTRLLHSFRLTDEQGNDLVHTPYKHPPLFNMEFALIGNLSKKSHEIEKIIKKMGGKVVSVIHNKLAAVISNYDEVNKMRSHMKEAKKCNIQVVSEDFLEECKTIDPILYIISQSLSEWGGDPFSRIEQSKLLLRREAAFYTKSLPEKVTYKWKDGCAVDPECGLEDNAHVYTRKVNGREVKYSVIFGLVDIENDKNSYYRVQLLQSNDQKLFWIFESWGRISTVIGSKRLTNYGSEAVAKTRFEELYVEKTGNKFGNLRFTKRPGKFYHLDIEIGPSQQILNSAYSSKLPPPVHELLKMLFDLRQMEKLMLSCDVDLKQMPLGKISAKQIRSAMTVLRDISKLISRNGTLAQLREASNKFYTLVPHGFSVNRPTIIDSLQIVNLKNEMLESLLNMELIYEYLDEGNGKGHPLDGCYHRLKADIIPIDKNASEFHHLASIVRNTHGATHNQYALEIDELFKICREGEDRRFQAYDNLANHQLLWHGSRLMNYVSILSHGLKIAPPEAPVTGYMFGKGIYFADCISKAANYCVTSRQNNTGLMLLCEVALGTTRDLYFSNNLITDLPNAVAQSVRACGATFPTKYDMIDGVYIASGDLCRASFPTALHYNEYVVYDPCQVKIKYLVKMKFHYR